jgi:hypothetical protein
MVSFQGIRLEAIQQQNVFTSSQEYDRSRGGVVKMRREKNHHRKAKYEQPPWFLKMVSTVFLDWINSNADWERRNDAYLKKKKEKKNA